METIALLFLGGINLLLLFFILFRNKGNRSEKVLLEGLLRIQNKVGEDLQKGREEQAKTMREELVAVRGEVEKKLSESVKHNVEGFSSVAKQLKEVHEATGKIVELSKGVNDLHQVLSRPQGRGIFGEMTLERLLADLFGDMTDLYRLQHTVEGFERVDAAIFVEPEQRQFLAIDAKFPLANAMPLLEGEGTEENRKAFAKDVKARADEISSKYIKPPKTLEFALMFVPSEAVYYLLLKDAKLHEKLLKSKVIPTSPNSLYAYLQVLATAFRGKKLEKKTREIQDAIIRVSKDFEKFGTDYAKVGERLQQAVKAYEDSQKDADRFTRRIQKLRQGEVQALPSKAPSLD